MAYTCLRTAASKALSLKKETGVAGRGALGSSLAGTEAGSAGFTAGVWVVGSAEEDFFAGSGVTWADGAGLTFWARSEVADRRMDNRK